MFEKLFGKVSDVVYHTIGPYAAERRQFLEYCRQQGYRKNYLKQIAGVLLAAASDLHAHGGLDVDRARLEAALARLEKALSACAIPDARRRSWHGQPGLVAFLRSL